MMDYYIKLNKVHRVALLNANCSMSLLVESVINQALVTQMTEYLCAARNAHGENRAGYRRLVSLLKTEQVQNRKMG